MAVQKDLDAHYTRMDKIFRLSLGEKGAYSCARFDGDFSITTEEAQLKKYQFIENKCNIKKGTKVLDIGCGWGSFVDYLTQRGVNAYGVVLAKGQADACIKNGLNVKHMNSKDITPQTFGKFDVVTAMGSPEHLCSVEEYEDGQQEKIYKTYFKQIAGLLSVGGRFYCQAMVFGPNMVKFEDIPFNKTDLRKKVFTNEELMDIICRVFPGSWLPYGKEGLIEPAKEHFKVISVDSGRLDYIETIKRWTAAFTKFNFKKYLLFASYIPAYLTNQSFREWMRRFKIQANLLVFEREIFEHYRIVFEKI
ncbi:MAG: SAM-dependent methyltransferase [Bacteroidetes bacterium CG23_combo_of_CG06-09_8_20_14_all_32_9]|nr:MAG: SAM-dependent methyltransferase [Bacteroidetes bacterium CG23_combo_of_CG06-09_8_20_14_all_32_9]